MRRFWSGMSVLLWLIASTMLIQAQPGAPTFAPAACPFDVPEDQQVECGYLTVPEDRSQPDGKTIDLAVAIVRSPNPTPAADPIIYLEGGPGGSALSGIEGWYDTGLGEFRDIILIDQRGTGYSEPFLGCPDDLDISEDADDLEFATACRDELVSRGVNLAAYNSAASAADINDLRLALGYEKVNLYGISYGTRLAMTIMRDYPEGLRSVVLDSAYPPQVDGYNEQAVNAGRAFGLLFADCAANAACNAAYPDLENVFYETVDKLNANPVLVDLGEGENEVNGDALINLIFETLYDTSAIPYLPLIIYEARDGVFDAYLNLGAEDLDDAGDDEEYTDFEAAFDDSLLDYLEFDDYDELYDYLEELSDDDYFDLLDEFFDSMTDAEFDELLMLYLDVDTLDDLSDADYDAAAEEMYAYFYGEEDEGAIEAEDDVDRSDADGMFNSVECYEELPFNTLSVAADLAKDLPEALQSAMLLQVELQLQTCELWGAGKAMDIETQVVKSDIPTLVLAGEYDPVTPPGWGKAAAEGLTHAFYFEFPGVGHSVIDSGECAVQIGVDFINNPTQEPDARCIASIGAPNFYTGD